MPDKDVLLPQWWKWGNTKVCARSRNEGSVEKEGGWCFVAWMGLHDLR
jgi:hypothetical protein